MRSEWKRRGLRVGGTEYRLSAVTKEATREEWTWLGFEFRMMLVSFHGGREWRWWRDVEGFWREQ